MSSTWIETGQAHQCLYLHTGNIPQDEDKEKR